jgi:hypothetical protein
MTDFQPRSVYDDDPDNPEPVKEDPNNPGYQSPAWRSWEMRRSEKRLQAGRPPMADWRRDMLARYDALIEQQNMIVQQYAMQHRLLDEQITAASQPEERLHSGGRWETIAPDYGRLGRLRRERDELGRRLADAKRAEEELRVKRNELASGAGSDRIDRGSPNIVYPSDGGRPYSYSSDSFRDGKVIRS